MSVKSIYKRLQNIAILTEDNMIFNELFQGNSSNDAKAMNQILKIAMNDRDERLISFLTSTSKIHLVFSQAIRNKDEKIINLLLSRGVGIGPWRPVNENRTAIHEAVYCDYLAIIDVLFAHNDNEVNHTDVNGLSHFHAACITGNTAIARHFILNLATDPRLCFRYVLSNDNKYNNTFTALHLAVKYSRIEIVELLLNYGLDPNVKDDFGMTPLHLACLRIDSDDDGDFSKKQLDVIEMLLKCGSDVNAKDCFGNTPLLTVFQDNKSKLVEDINVGTLFYQRDYDNRMLWKCKAELLLKYNADVQIFNDKGDSVLHLLIKMMESLRRPKALAKVSFDDKVYVEIANMLLDNGAKVNVWNEKKETPLQLAVSMLSLDMVELLLKYDANVNTIRLDEEEFCYSEDVIPSLEATENLLGIVERLSSFGLNLDKNSNLAVLKFLIGNHINCRYDVWTDRNASYKLKNLLELGTDENIITAFSKFPMDMYDTSFKSQSMKKQMVQQLYEHVTILEKGGFYMSNKVHKSLNTKILSLEKCILKVLGPNKKLSDVDLQEFESEFQAMKSTSLSSSTSLHDMLTMNPRKIYYYIKNYGYKKTGLHSEEGQRNYSRSDGIIKGLFAKSLVRKYVSKSATEYFRSLIDMPLPDLCCEKIFDYLDNDNLLNLCAASATIEVQQRKKFKSDNKTFVQ